MSSLDEQLAACNHKYEAAMELLASALAQVNKLTARRDELLATIARISQAEPLPDEIENALKRQGALLAEIGTLRSVVSSLRAALVEACDGWQTGIENDWRDTYSPGEREEVPLSSFRVDEQVRIAALRKLTNDTP